MKNVAFIKQCAEETKEAQPSSITQENGMRIPKTGNSVISACRINS